MSEKSLAKINQENLELRKENEALQQTVTLLLSELEGLKNLPATVSVDSNTIALPVQRIPRTTEQEILEEQILRLDAISRQRMLSLEETRALDLLIKNKRLLEPKTDIEPDFHKVPQDNTEDLLRLADATKPETARETDTRADSGS